MRSYKKWLQNAPMKKKLIPTQLISFLMVLLLTLISVVSIFTVNSLSNKLVDENVSNTEDLNSIIETMYLCRVTGRDILLQEDVEARAELYTKYLAYFDTLDTMMDEFATKLEGDRANVFADIIVSKNAYKESMILSADLKNEGGKDAEALAALRSVTPVATDFFGDIAIFLDEEKQLMNEAVAKNDQTVMIVTILCIGISALVIIVIMVLIRVFQNLMASQLVGLQNTVSEVVTTGDTTITIPSELFTKDEVGAIAVELKNITALLVEYSRIANSIASKNYDVDVSIKSKKDTLSISLDTMVSASNAVLVDIKDVAQHVSSESQSVFQNAQMLESGVTQQASSLDQLSGLLENITAEIEESAQSSKNSVALADTMANDIDTIDERIKQMLEAMAEITSSSEEIRRIITTIDDISFQTNVLALNAAVEAARAGVAGSGFAVVADEVRTLASKSGVAAKQTAALIEESVRSVANGEKIAESVAQALSTVIESTSSIMGSIESINKSTTKQITSIEDIHKEVNQISQVVQSNKDNSNESTSISKKLNSYADNMTSLVADFTLKRRK